MRILFLFPAVLALSACAGDPLRDVPKLQDVEVAAPTPVVEAVAAPVETDANAGFFQRLLRKRQVGEEVIPAPDAVTDTQEARPVPPEASASADAGVEGDMAPAAAEEKPRRRAAWLFGGAKAKAKNPEATDPATVPDPDAELAPPAPDTVANVASADTPAATVEEPKKRGLFGFGKKRIPATPATLQKASLSEPAETVLPEVEKTARSGLFARKKAARLTGPDARSVQPGEVLPFGEIARACHVKGAQLGKQVAKYPERGAKYRVYDSAPGNLALHTFYVTGFRDGCPRQITAALAVFGTAQMYETLRYALPQQARSKKPTDKAYEKVKSRTCGVSKSKPCGAKIGKMEKATVFLSLYNRFEGAQGWTNLLLSDGKVMAKDVQG